MSCCPGGPPKLPTFNILVNIWRGPYFWPVVPPPALANVICQLTYSHFNLAGNLIGVLPMFLKVPKLTDIRGPAGLGMADFVECPAGSGRYYNVNFVDDVGKGFANEHRVAVILQAPPWPVPTP